MGKQKYPSESAKGIKLTKKKLALFYSYCKEGESLSDVVNRFILWSLRERK